MIFQPILTGISAASARLIAWWNAVVERWHPIALIVVVWALLTLPLVFFRGFNSDEGVAVTIARSALEDGYWLSPHIFNDRFVERPTLLSWIIAAISWPFGSVNQFTARLPIVLALLGGCLLIYGLLRRVGVGVSAAVLGAALFLACPLVQRSYVMTTADMPLAVLLFAAFVLWWSGHASGRISAGRWGTIGGVLAIAALLKGPQPIAYFALGVGLFVLGSRSWREIPGLVLAGAICVIPLAGWYAAVYAPGDETQWAGFMRLHVGAPLSNPPKALLEMISETLPAALLAAVFFATQGFRGSGSVSAAFVRAAACYAFTATLVVLFWPGGSTARYFFPMVLPLCVFGALAVDALSERWPLIVAPALTVALAILAYAFVYSDIASPLLPKQFRSAPIDAARIAELVRAAPGPIYRTGAVGLNVMPYVPGRIISTNIQNLETVAGPAWFAVPIDEANVLLSKRGNALRVVMPFGSDEEWRLLRLEK
jgi:4-amino-4-deoxy-L-arabinose transferase-like glycosyltransferase